MHNFIFLMLVGGGLCAYQRSISGALIAFHLIFLEKLSQDEPAIHRLVGQLR